MLNYDLWAGSHWGGGLFPAAPHVCSSSCSEKRKKKIQIQTNLFIFTFTPRFHCMHRGSCTFKKHLLVKASKSSGETPADGWEANSIVLCVPVSYTPTCEPMPCCFALHVVVRSGSGVFLGGTSSGNVQMWGRTFLRGVVIFWKPSALKTNPCLIMLVRGASGGSGYYYMAQRMRTVCWKPSAVS